MKFDPENLSKIGEGERRIKTIILEFENRQLKKARMSLAYFEIGLLLSLCVYFNDGAGFFFFVSLTVIL